MTGQAIELSYAVRLRVVLKYFGQLCLVLTVLTAVPLAVALGAGEFSIAARYLAVLAVLALPGATFSRLTIPRRIQTNEAMVLAALIFLFASLLMTLPMTGAGLSFVDALFESISATTTTGLSTLATVEDKPQTFLFARAWMQWYGGLGIVVLSLAVVIQPGSVAKRLAVTEEFEDDLVGGTKAHARRVLVVYGLLTGAGVAGLWILGGDLFQAVLYAFSSVSTGGFSPHARSLAGYGGWPVQWFVTGLCLAGAVSLPFYSHLVRRGWRAGLEDLQLRPLLAAGLGVTVLLVLCQRLITQTPWPQIWHHAPLLALSAQSTAGFSTIEPARLDAASKVVLILAMAVGGGLGSTAGGIKILRLMILLRLLQVMLVRTSLPAHAVLDARLGGRRLQAAEIQGALCIIILFLLVVIGSWIPFVAAGHDPLDALFEVVSATGTVGLSTGIAGPELPAALKAVLCADMLMGRLEMVAWLVLFFPRTWFGKRVEVT